jgi:hypothetical protein
MLQAKLKLVYLISAIIAVLAALTSAGGLFLPGLYRDNSWTTAQLRGNDLVTLLVAVPLLVGALVLARQGSVRAQLIWLAMLAYMLYNYIFYLYGTTFNSFFLLYVALLTLSLVGLVGLLLKIDPENISRSFRANTPHKAIASYMLFIAVVLGGMWLSQSLGFVFSGQVPATITEAGANTSVVFATDLALLVPAMVLGAFWLWQARSWGYVLAAVLMLKGATYTLALLAMGLFAALGGTLGEDWIFLPLWGVLCLGCLIAAGTLLLKVQQPDKLFENKLMNTEAGRSDKTLLPR